VAGRIGRLALAARLPVDRRQIPHQLDLQVVAPGASRQRQRFGGEALRVVRATGLDEHERFLASIRAYKPIFTKWANSGMMRSINMETGESGKVVLDDMPQHAFVPEALSRSLARTLPDFAVMLILIIVFFAGAYISFLKYDVR